MVEILNRHDNTKELLEKFPIEHRLNTYNDYEANIENRILTGFENWNRGMEAWVEWGKILYRDDSIYHVHDVKFTLKEYQMVSSMAFRQSNMFMGAFHHMVVCGDWCAINYDISSVNKVTGVAVPGSVTEFVRFRKDDIDGAVVDEGFGGTRSTDYDAIIRVLRPEELAAQNAIMDETLNYVIPDEKDLTKKYIVKNPSVNHSEIGNEMTEVITDYVDRLNNNESIADLLSSSFTVKTNDVDYDAKGFVKHLSERNEKMTVTYKFFDNLLLHTDWVAFKAQVVINDKVNNKIYAQSEMTFAHIIKENGSYVIDRLVIKR